MSNLEGLCSWQSGNTIYRDTHAGMFESFYGPDGDWVRLFRQAEGFLGTELLRAAGKKQVYVTIDRWESAEAYTAFRSKFKEEYGLLDAHCESLTGLERELGTFETAGL